jgi:tRNA threonylcarbamoyladenosine biosynthesis protein TsaE
MEIDRVAAEFIKQSQRHTIIAFYGEMGAGKTTFIKALCRNLDVTDTVSSPTFSLINEYKTRLGESVFHFDFYRIEHIEEVYDFGYEDYFFSGNKCLIEWPEKVEELLPENCLRVHITELPDKGRKLEF